MKTIQEQIKLTNEELENIVGGVTIAIAISGEVDNINGVSNCICDYTDYVIKLKNINNIGGCKCRCNIVTQVQSLSQVQSSAQIYSAAFSLKL
ncbi:MAG: hypothetical protein LBG80_03420 [Bacteroidales bacterium]|jgi:hypothetical protein|nr:hypothetical protein [Bacteroidales bacterium]